MNRDMCIGYVCGPAVGFALLCLLQGCIATPEDFKHAADKNYPAWYCPEGDEDAGDEPECRWVEVIEA